ncbi:MAG TPA: hypothetical protein VK616_00850 [Flavitalea sp.]|nr:hypothetical protein [Flavitalea sp.]
MKTPAFAKAMAGKSAGKSAGKVAPTLLSQIVASLFLNFNFLFSKAFRQKTLGKPDRNASRAFAKAMPGEEEKQLLLMPGDILCQ